MFVFAVHEVTDHGKRYHMIAAHDMNDAVKRYAAERWEMKVGVREVTIKGPR